jgi:hypothetical protein
MSNFLTEYFEQTFIINLPNRHDRREEMAGQLQTIGLGLEYPGMTIFPAVRPESSGDFPSIGARGCFLSHLGVLRQAWQAGYQRILILEDDVDFSKDFQLIAPKIIDALQNIEWSVFYGGYRVGQELPVTPDVPSLISIKPDVAVQTSHFVAVQGQAIAHLVAYLEQMLQRPGGHPEGGPMHVDGAYNWFRRSSPQFKTVLAVPQLGFQRPSRTDIHDLKWHDRMPCVRELVAMMRRVKRAIGTVK